MSLIRAVAALSLAALPVFAQSPSRTQGVERAFTIAEPDLVPEGIAYDPQTGSLFVSSTYQRRIVRINVADGAVSDFTPRGDNALYGGLGMRVDAARRRLWVAHSSAGAGMPIRDDASTGRSGLALYDLDTGRLIRNLTPPGDALHFLNDVALAADGGVYVTDSMTSTLYRVAVDGEALEPFLTLPDAASGNGVALSDDERTLYIANNRDGALKIDLATRQITALTLPEGMQLGADGLYFWEGDLVAVQPYVEDCRVCRFDLDAAGTRVVARKALAAAHPDFLQPTTGAIVGDDIYVIANAQLQHFRRLYEQHAGAPPRDQLQEIVILRVPLTPT